jgi:hypothetical protein
MTEEMVADAEENNWLIAYCGACEDFEKEGDG